MIYRITLTNRKTGQELCRDYDLDNGSLEEGDIIFDMKETLENSNKF